MTRLVVVLFFAFLLADPVISRTASVSGTKKLRDNSVHVSDGQGQERRQGAPDWSLAPVSDTLSFLQTGSIILTDANMNQHPACALLNIFFFIMSVGFTFVIMHEASWYFSQDMTPLRLMTESSLNKLQYKLVGFLCASTLSWAGWAAVVSQCQEGHKATCVIYRDPALILIMPSLLMIFVGSARSQVTQELARIRIAGPADIARLRQNVQEAQMTDIPTSVRLTTPTIPENSGDGSGVETISHADLQKRFEQTADDDEAMRPVHADDGSVQNGMPSLELTRMVVHSVLVERLWYDIVRKKIPLCIFGMVTAILALLMYFISCTIFPDSMLNTCKGIGQVLTYDQVVGRLMCVDTPCPPNSHRIDDGLVTCQCEPGRYGVIKWDKDKWVGGCQACQIGKYMPDFNATVCLDCPLGYSTPSTSALVCEACGFGLYSAGSRGCQPAWCPPTYAPVTNALNQLVECRCAPGYFGVEDATTLTLNVTSNSVTPSIFPDCELCPQGRGSGPLTPSSLTSTSKCAVTFGPGRPGCPAGSRRKDAYSGACLACPLGSSAPAGSSECRPCDRGSYANILGQYPCTVCGPGNVTVSVGAVAASDCVSCPRFYFAAGIFGCVPVSDANIKCPNTYQAVYNEEAMRTECRCAEGYSGPQVLLWNHSTSTLAPMTGEAFQNCTQCDGTTMSGPLTSKQLNSTVTCTSWITAGSQANFCATRSAVNSTFACVGCPAGKEWSPVPPSCTPCAAGKYSPDQGLPCRDCPASFYSAAGSSACTLCESGKYVRKGEAACTPLTCGGSNMTAVYNPNSASTECRCAPGCYGPKVTRFTNDLSTELGVVGGECKACPTSTRSGPLTSNSLSATQLCTDTCPAGSRAVDSSKCLECEPGKYRPNESLESECLPCDKSQGYFALLAGSRTCMQCPLGTYTDDGIACKSCEIGKYGIMGRCLDCPRAFYSESPGVVACTPCPSGMMTNAPGQSNPKACTPCNEAEGKGLDPSSGDCKLCSPTYEAKGGVCVKCAAGRTSINGAMCSLCTLGFYGSPSDGTCMRQSCPSTYAPVRSNSSDPSSPTTCRCAPGFYGSNVLVLSWESGAQGVFVSTSGNHGSCHACPATRGNGPLVENNPTATTQCDIDFSTTGCRAGSTRPSMMTNACELCPVNTYALAGNVGPCIPCLNGTSPPGSKLASECK